MCGEDIDILEDFTYLGSVVQNSGGSGHEVFRQIGLAHAVMNALDTSIWHCRYLCSRTKIRIFWSLVLSVLLYGCETWTVTGGLKRQIKGFGNKFLRRIIGYCWFDHVTNQRLLHETGLRPIACTIRQRQLRLYGHVARFPEVDPAYQAVFERDNPGWKRPRGRPQSSWLGKVDESCWDILGMGRWPACRLAWRHPREWRRRVGEVTHHPACVPDD